MWLLSSNIQNNVTVYISFSLHHEAGTKIILKIHNYSYIYIIISNHLQFFKRKHEIWIPYTIMEWCSIHYIVHFIKFEGFKYFFLPLNCGHSGPSRFWSLPQLPPHPPKFLCHLPRLPFHQLHEGPEEPGSSSEVLVSFIPYCHPVLDTTVLHYVQCIFLFNETIKCVSVLKYINSWKISHYTYQKTCFYILKDNIKW